MKPTLLAQPYANLVSHILRNLENGKPLSCDQLNFLSSHEKLLSSYGLDQAIAYYLKSYRSKPRIENKPDKVLSFIFPKQKLNYLTVHQIKHAVQLLLKNNLSHVDLKMTLEQFAQFRLMGVKELIFWHGNQFLTGAPFYLGGIPHVIYFQWGNLFGVVKLQVLTAEKSLQGNVLIYFEEMSKRNLYQCIREYERNFKHELSHANIQTEQFSHYKTPTPSLTPVFYEIDAEKKG